MEQLPLPSHRVITGRRAAARLRVRLPATLTLLDGRLNVILENLSEYGARIGYDQHRPFDLRLGADAVLAWHRFEAFGTVRWTGSEGCGLMFDVPIGQRELMLTRTLDERAHLPCDRDRRREFGRRWVDGEI